MRQYTTICVHYLLLQIHVVYIAIIMQNKHDGTKIATANDYICVPLTNAWNVCQSLIMH